MLPAGEPCNYRWQPVLCHSWSGTGPGNVPTFPTLQQQVQLAIREGRGAGGAQRPAPQDGAAGGAAPGRQGSAAAVHGVVAAPLLPEGAEAALLYVRFRAAAEPGLKGEAFQPPAAARLSASGLQSIRRWNIRSMYISQLSERKAWTESSSGAWS